MEEHAIVSPSLLILTPHLQISTSFFVSHPFSEFRRDKGAVHLLPWFSSDPKKKMEATEGKEGK
jgi:hypothetical protein